jgi:DNA-binding Lrp family transcriptional regulator
MTLKHRTITMEDPILEYQVLDAVHENGGQVTQRHISERVGRSVASVNFALRLLVVKGHIKISGASPRKLHYHLTPTGILQKTVLAYNFLKRQSALYEEVRKDLLEKLKGLAGENTRRASVYGWTPFTEAAILYLISQGIQVGTIYSENPADVPFCNRIPILHIKDFKADCDVLVVLEPLSAEREKQISVRKLVCIPLD